MVHRNPAPHAADDKDPRRSVCSREFRKSKGRQIAPVFDSVELCDIVSLKHLLGRPCSPDGPVFRAEHIVRDPLRKIQLVKRHEDCHIALMDQFLQDIEKLQFVPDIEKGCGLVENEKLRFLADRPG